jgi:hypothetical protein
MKNVVMIGDGGATIGLLHLAEVKLSPQPILFTGIDRADALLVCSLDGLQKARERADFDAGDGLLIADTSLASELPARARKLPLRGSFGAGAAALGAIAALIAQTGWLDRESPFRAAELTGGRHAASMRQALQAGFAL